VQSSSAETRHRSGTILNNPTNRVDCCTCIHADSFHSDGQRQHGDQLPHRPGPKL
jgi:hypothetical protein